MSKNLANYRRTYTKGQLLEKEVPGDPLELFQHWFEEVEASMDLIEVNAMNLATVGADGYPHNRIVLLKEFGEEGFIFYTNYSSNKGKALADNAKCCLSFFWPKLERQVIIKGVAERSDEQKAIEYFHSRPRGSQLGAWVSNQSSVISSREVLEENLKEVEDRYQGEVIPKPEYWGGYLVRPTSYEFWQGRPNRLHDRVYYSKEEESWKTDRLAP